MQMLKRIHVKGWKSIRDQSINLNSLTVMIGANGSGKSNLLSLIGMFGEIFSSEPNMRSYVAINGTASSLLHYGPRETKSIDVELAFETSSGELTYATRWVPTLNEELIFEDERIEYVQRGVCEPQIVTLGSGHSETNLIELATRGDSIARNCLSLLRSCRVYHFHNTSSRSEMRLPSYVEANRFLLSEANNLAPMLYLYRHQYPIAYRRITTLMQRVMPGFEEFVLEPSRLNEAEIVLKWKQKNREYEFGPHQFPDGALRIAALSAMLLQPTEDLPMLIGIDEPELGLHPRALELFSDMVISTSTDAQMILATQSSTLVDYFDPCNILVADRIDGATEFKNLNAEKLGLWLERYSLGELWERNYFGGGLDS